ncbi:MAG: hypothetical protein HYZ29_09510 [Myxococcales bacterium]|nr:hypothetical protein [Myxococcales bacterium]
MRLEPVRSLGGWFVIAAALLACKGGSKGEITQPKLGTISGSMPNLKLRAETTRLPLVPSRSGNTDKNFGICFHYKNPSALGDVAIVVTPPSAIKTDSVELQKEKVGGGVRMKLDPLSGSEGDYCQEMFFEAGDPPGRWRFELQAGTSAVKAWDVEVYAP